MYFLNMLKNVKYVKTQNVYFFSRDKQSGQPHLQPCQLQLPAIPETLKSSKIHVPGTPTTPVTPPSAFSPASSSSLTPDMQT